MRQMREPSEKLHNVLSFLSGAMVVVLVLVIVVGVRTKAQNTDGQEAAGAQTAEEQTAAVTQNTAETEKWQEGVVTYQGKDYIYDQAIQVFLMMGVDEDGPVEQASDLTKGGQADALFLLVSNSDTKELSVISINRNTMTDITLCDEQGNDMGTLNAQICLQHAFGDGMRTSCSATVDVVSKLFGDLPISGYLAMNMGGIPAMNDAVGGVTLDVLQDVSYPDADVELKKGETVTLSGTEAYYYLHGRDTDEYDSATKRLRREEQYIAAYIGQLRESAAGDSAKAAAVYDAVSDYLVSSMDVAGMIGEWMDYDFSEERMYTVPGETVLGEPVGDERYEEYHVDEEAMQELIMEVFYTPAG